jgi:hypothetical protein
MDEKTHVIRSYTCNICNEVHKVKLKKSLIKNRSQFPMPYVFLHGTLKNILTTLYLDKNLEIRAVEVQELKDDDIFSKDQVIQITATLMEEIERLRDENSKLAKEINKIKKNSNL